MIDVILTFDYNGLLEISEILIVSYVFFDFKFHQIRFLPGLCPGPRRGAYITLPRPLVGWGGDIPPISPSSASSFPVGPRRCGVRRAHQMVNPALQRELCGWNCGSADRHLTIHAPVFLLQLLINGAIRLVLSTEISNRPA